MNLTVISFSCDQTISGCDATAFSNDASAQSALISTIVSSSSSTGLTPEVVLTTIAASTAVHIEADGLQVKYVITFTMASGSMAPAAVYTAFTDDLKASISGGDFLAALTSHGLAVFANANVSLDGLTISGYTVQVQLVDPDSSSGHKRVETTTGFIVGVTIGSVAVAALLVGLWYYHFFYAKTKVMPSNTSSIRQISPLEVHPIEGFYDVERINTPSNLNIIPNPALGARTPTNSPGKGKHRDGSWFTQGSQFWQDPAQQQT